MRTAYHAASAPDAQTQLEALDKTHPGAAASLREGLAETLNRAAAGRAADPGPHAALHQHHRVDDLDLL
jgi:putative transposase